MALCLFPREWRTLVSEQLTLTPTPSLRKKEKEKGKKGEGRRSESRWDIWAKSDGDAGRRFPFSQFPDNLLSHLDYPHIVTTFSFQSTDWLIDCPLPCHSNCSRLSGNAGRQACWDRTRHGTGTHGWNKVVGLMDETRQCTGTHGCNKTVYWDPWMKQGTVVGPMA